MDNTQSKSKAASTMRGLVEDAKKTKLSQANNNNNSVASGRVKPMASMTSASTSRQLKGVIKTPTTTSSVGAKKTPQSMQQQVGKSTKLAASSTAATAATTTATTTANSSSAKPATSKAQAQKGQNQPQQAQPTQQPQSQQLQPYNNNSNTIALPKASHANTNEELANGVQDTIYLCNFRVSVDGEWLCLKELQDIDVAGGVKTVGGGAAALNVSSAGGGSGAGTTSGGFVQQSHQTNHQFGQRNKRFSGLSTVSGGNTFEDNGIMAIENLIGRRLCDVVGSNALAAPHQQHKNVGLIGGTLAEWSHLYATA
ncbi:hypothetical protein ACLKA6_008919 [Drosophila palustris]